MHSLQYLFQALPDGCGSAVGAVQVTRYVSTAMKLGTRGCHCQLQNADFVFLLRAVQILSMLFHEVYII